MKSTIPETELIDLLQSGDHRGLEYVYDHYSTALYGVLCRICRDEVLAEDLLQQTFTKIWQNAKNYDSTKGTLFTWMLTIARRLAIDTIRSRDFRDQALNRSIEDFVDTDEIGSEQAVIPETIDLRHLVGTLPTDQRQVIELMYFQGYSQSEISEDFAIPLGTVKSRSRMALQSLRSLFNEET